MRKGIDPRGRAGFGKPSARRMRAGTRTGTRIGTMTGTMTGIPGRRVVAAHTWRWVAVGCFALLVLAAVVSPARAGVAFGVRAGYADVDGNAFLGSGRIGGTPLYGIQAILPVVPLVSLSIAGEQTTKSKSFQAAIPGDGEVSGKVKWTDQALYAAARIRVPGLIGLYGGAGVGLHRQKADLSNVAEVTLPATTNALDRSAVPGPQRGGASGDPLQNFLQSVQKESNDVSWHAIVGMEFSLTPAPIALFAEGRVDDIQGTTPRTLAIYGGLNLRLP